MHILTTRADLTPAEIRHRMGSRWRQENYYRYARIHFDLDSHDGYRTTGDGPGPDGAQPGQKDRLRPGRKGPAGTAFRRNNQ